MLKYLKQHPIALLALFLSLGGTSYAANTVVAPPPPTNAATTAYAQIFALRHGAPYVEVNRASGIEKANVLVWSDNTICLDGLQHEPRNVQVTPGDWARNPTVWIRPASGPCAGKQVRITLNSVDGSYPYYHQFFVTVQS
ncbi:hypothetical protein DVA67_008345 [Solirubrobacter sp. CPCC 204708]|uniref:Uncharacterized protein n=1 Tax=Solirubrobacter deserti TaxID=2282478 RepID=A0ABT4RDZ2_9ACTN|nr:hypothetical protein [Solirubrobacter deserti]MBE2315981.1 hypothetical protein [Solirubrobacter deserti]MDA0136732.1 hypothetical protein [Solirubrobacter deserti]